MFALSNFGQDRMYVTAKNGLLVRDQPSLKANKINHLPNNTMIMILKKTGIQLAIQDKGEEIEGEWVQVYGFGNHHVEGYVFDGYLTSEKPEIWYSGKEAYYKTYSFDNLQDGTFESQSISSTYLNKELPVIQPNIVTLNAKQYPYFFNPYNNEIVLFENHELNNLKPIGKLNSLAQVDIDSTLYKIKFKDFTNCVWNRIRINEQFYYTDIDIHDFSSSKRLSHLNQKVKIVGQYDGYDGAYHLGYPEYFFMIFTNDENKVIHRTKVLDFYLNDEFAMEEDILRLKWNEINSLYEITLIGADEKITVIWDGKKSEIKNGK